MAQRALESQVLYSEFMGSISAYYFFCINLNIRVDDLTFYLTEFRISGYLGVLRSLFSHPQKKCHLEMESTNLYESKTATLKTFSPTPNIIS